MKTIEVGAFEAKTHLGSLLTEVEGGAVVHIMRRHRRIASLIPAREGDNTQQALRALDRMAALRRGRRSMPAGGIRRLIEEGRKR